MTTTLPIKKQDRTITLDIQKSISSELVKKKIYLAELINAALKHYFKDEEDLVINNEYSVYKLPIINEEINIIDFKINSLDVNVVATVDREKNQNVYIPKIYKTLNYKPDIILFVNLKKSLAKMEILGLLDNINLISNAIPKENLIPSENLIDILKTKRTKYNSTEDSVIKTAKELMLGYINNELSEEGKKIFCKSLLTSQEIRKNYKLFYAINCKFIAIVENCDVKDRDYTLDVFSGRLPNANNSILLEENIKQNFEEPAQNNIPTENVILEKEEVVEKDNINLNENNIEFQNDDLPIENAEPLQENVEEDILQNIQEEDLDIQNKPEEQQEIQDVNLENDILDNILPEETNSNELTEQSAIELNDNEEIIDMGNVELKLDDNNVDNNVDNLSEEKLDLELLDDVDFSDIDELKEDKTLEEINQEKTEEVLNAQEPEPEQIQPSPIPASSLVASDYTPIEEPTPLEQAIHESVEETQEDIFNMLSELSDNQENNVEINSIDEDDLNYLEDNSYLDNIPTKNPVNEIVETKPDVSENKLQDMPEFSTEKQNFDMNVDENMEFMAPEQDEIDARLGNNAINTALEHNMKKSSNKGLLIILLLFIAAGGCLAGVFFKFMNGNLLSQIKKQESVPVPVASEEKTAQDVQDNDIPAPEPIPAPVDTTQKEEIPQPPTAENNEKPDLPPVDGAPALPDAPEKPLPKIPQGVKPKQLHEVVGMAISKDYNKVRISHVWWGVPSGLDNVPVVSQYLKITGESIKSALSRSLADATDMAQNYGVVLSITYKKDGSVVRTQMTKGSGSQQIDGIIQSTVEQTLNLTKMPALKINKEEYNVELHIDL